MLLMQPKADANLPRNRQINKYQNIGICINLFFLINHTLTVKRTTKTTSYRNSEKREMKLK